MRLRTLETKAGTVLVIDQATPEEVDAQRNATMDSWIERGGPFVMTLAGTVEIPESDNYHPPAEQRALDVLRDHLRAGGRA